mmetsp:Transcript_45455/g.116306  ORF Transcript_45455/g.116306 Transcript_45455/m.116306 type:complete len:209 (+) Transcript_45455:202-828(+)
MSTDTQQTDSSGPTSPVPGAGSFHTLSVLSCATVAKMSLLGCMLRPLSIRLCPYTSTSGTSASCERIWMTPESKAAMTLWFRTATPTTGPCAAPLEEEHTFSYSPDTFHTASSPSPSPETRMSDAVAPREQSVAEPSAVSALSGVCSVLRCLACPLPASNANSSSSPAAEPAVMSACAPPSDCASVAAAQLRCQALCPGCSFSGLPCT